MFALLGCNQVVEPGWFDFSVSRASVASRDTSIIVSWAPASDELPERVRESLSYSVLIAAEEGVSSATVDGLAGGQMIEDAVSPLEITGLDSEVAYYVVVVAKVDGANYNGPPLTVVPKTADDLGVLLGSVEGGATNYTLGQDVVVASPAAPDAQPWIVACAPGYTSGFTSEGGYLAYTIEDGVLGTTPVAILPGGADYALYGGNFASTRAGDYNSDGLGDLVVAAPMSSVTAVFGGTVYQYVGDGTSLTNRSVIVSGPGASTKGLSIANVGDINADGYDDLAVGSDENSNGLIEIFAGGVSGLSGSPIWEVSGDSAGDYLDTVADAGDINGDGLSDFVGRANGVAGTAFDGKYSAWYSEPGIGLLLTPGWALTGDELGYTVPQISSHALVDVNGDGFDDLVLYGGPEIKIFAGSAIGLGTTATWTLDIVATTVVNLGDVNADGYDDLGVGEPYYTGAYTAEGRVLVLLGGPDGPSEIAPEFVRAGGAPNTFLSRVFALRDLNGDGAADFAISDSTFENPEVAEGYFEVRLGAVGASAQVTFGGTQDDASTESALDLADLGVSFSGVGDVTCVINWGDETIETIESCSQLLLEESAHTYTAAGTFRVSVTATDSQARVSAAVSRVRVQ